MKKLVISCITVIIIIGAIFIVGSEVINQSWRPTLNANEKIISKSLDKGVKPKDVIGNISYHVDNIKNMDKGFYQLFFYDEKDELNVCAGFEILE